MIDVSNRPLIKICGLRTLEQARATSDAGADLIGFVFAESKRQVTAAEVRPIVDAMTGSAIPVGLFVDGSIDAIQTTARAAGVSVLQLHRRFGEDLARVEMPYYLVQRTEPGETFDSVAPALDRALRSPNPPLWIMVDAYHPGQHGGTGLLADWDLAAKLAASFPIMLAGGLNPGNVADAIQQVRPAAVDVSSGVEVDGVKSPERIEAFVENARTAFASYSSASSEKTTHS